MQLAVKGCNTPHPKGSWSLRFPPLSTLYTPRHSLGPTIAVAFRSSFPSHFLRLGRNSSEQRSAEHPQRSHLCLLSNRWCVADGQPSSACSRRSKSEPVEMGTRCQSATGRLHQGRGSRSSSHSSGELDDPSHLRRCCCQYCTPD